MLPVFFEAAAPVTTTATTAGAQAPANAGSAGMIPMLVVTGVFFLIMYFLMIRPQKKRDKEMANMRNSLEVGDTVTTIGGIIGIVSSLKDDTIVIETGGERNKIRFKRSAIAEVEKLNMDDSSDKNKK